MVEGNIRIVHSADGLVADVRSMIEQTREGVAHAVSAGMTLLYWRIGKRIQTEILEGRRADYGKKIISTLSRQLVEEFRTGFSEKSLRRMVPFAEVFPGSEIVVSLVRQLSWMHILALLPLKDPLQREFYAEMCRIERWSVRTLRKKIGSMLYERAAISKKPEEVARAELAQLRSGDRLSPNIDSDDFYLDLLFYHRHLRRLIVIDLKLDDFKAEEKGQMELYLRWLAKHEQQPGEAPPLGFILCAGKKQEQVELLELDQSGIHGAEYLTVLPSRDLLRRKLHTAIETSRERMEAKKANV